MSTIQRDKQFTKKNDGRFSQNTEIIGSQVNLIKRNVLATKQIAASSETLLVDNFEIPETATAWALFTLENNRPHDNTLSDMSFIIEFTNVSGNYTALSGELVARFVIPLSARIETGKGLSLPQKVGEAGSTIIISGQYFNAPIAKFMRITVANTRASIMRLQNPTIVFEGNFNVS